MEKIEVIVTSHFTDSVVGSMTRKQRLFLDPNTADRLEALGLVKPVNPRATAAKVPRQTAPRVAGGGVSSASLQAAPASPPKTVMPPAEPAGSASQSTTPGDSPEIPTFSTHVTASGGTATDRKPMSLPASAGRKTK